MQWLDPVLSLTAVAEFLLAALSGIWLFDYARQARTRARRVGAGALAGVCFGMALEAALFLSQASAAGAWPRLAALLFVRGFLLGATTLLASIVWRGLSRR